MEPLDTKEKLQASIKALIKLEPKFAEIYEKVGLPPLRLHPQGFEALLGAIIGQQVSTTVSQRIRERLKDAGLDTYEGISSATDEYLREHGVSKQKIRYLRSLCEHQIDYEALANKEDDEIVKALTAITGVGTWTAQIYLIFSLNRPDVCVNNDLAIKAAAMSAFSLPERPTEKIMHQLSEKWSPHRSAACYLLWSYYKYINSKE